jgi:hypothetical protein
MSKGKSPCGAVHQEIYFSMKNLLVIVSAILLCSCATNSRRERLDPEIAVEYSELDKYWIFTSVASPDYPKQYMRSNWGACVNMRFVVGEDGRAHDIELLEMWPTIIEPYVDSAKSAISKLRFSPSITNPTKKIVLTNYVTTFFKSPSLDQHVLEEEGKKIRQNCRLSVLGK